MEGPARNEESAGRGVNACPKAGVPEGGQASARLLALILA